MTCSGAAPCQCHSPGGVYTVSPGCITTTAPPRDWTRPTPSVTCKGLAHRVCVPRGTRTRCEPHDVDAHPGRFLALVDDVEIHVTGEHLGRSFGGGLFREFLHSHSCGKSAVLTYGTSLSAVARAALLRVKVGTLM